jgi:hypothetical protein
MTLPCCLVHSVLSCCFYDAKTIEYTAMDLSAQVDRNLSATAATLNAIIYIEAMSRKKPQTPRTRIKPQIPRTKRGEL